jgi:hypothetical protein
VRRPGHERRHARTLIRASGGDATGVLAYIFVVLLVTASKQGKVVAYEMVPLPFMFTPTGPAADRWGDRCG